nr:facilitated trehalose transporter Tret1-like isoform X2 [Leptinotarsa decemlineata]
MSIKRKSWSELMMENKETEKNVSYGTIFQIYTSFIVGLLAITDGMAYGWTSPMIPYLTSDKSHLKMSLHEAEWMETWMMIGVIFALPITVQAVDRIGRRNTILFSCIILVACWIGITIASRVEYIYAARFLKGVGLNMAYVAAPMYLGEIAHKNIRGLMSGIVFTLMMVGTLLIYILGPLVPYYVPSIIASVLLSTQVFAFFFLPESPYYLLNIKKYEEAKNALQRFRGNSDIEEEFEEIVKTMESDKQEKSSSLKAIFQVKHNRKSLIIVLVLDLSQPFACQEIMLMNLHEILNSAQSTYMSTTSAGIIFGCIMLVSAIVSSLIVDRFGRKFLLITSSISTGICLVTLAIYFHMKRSGHNLDSLSWIPIVSVLVYAFVYKIGIGMVPIVITSEIFTTKIKALGMTISDGVYVVGSIASLQMFFALKSTFGIHVPFYLFTCCALVTSLFTIFLIPETKGKTMEEIQTILKGE